MKVIFLTALVPLTLLSCQKEEKINDATEITQKQTTTTGTTTTTPITAEVKRAEATATLSVEPLDEAADLGKAIFSQNDKVMISFNSVSQKGKIKINGKEYALTKLTFSDNNYEISGNGITITANNGNFQEMVSDCTYGTFPEVMVKLNGKTTVLKDVKVQDCPNYN